MAVAGKWKLHLLSSRGDDAVTGIAGHITGILANLVSDGSRYSHDFKEATGPGNLQRRAIYLSGLSVRENPRPSKPANKKETAVGGLFFWVGLWLGPSAVAKSPCYTRRVLTSSGGSWGWGSGGRGVDACGYVENPAPGYFRLGRLVIEADFGSASSRGRRPEDAWFVRVRNAEASVVITWGLTRSNAEHLASRLAEVIAGVRPGCGGGGERAGPA